MSDLIKQNSSTPTRKLQFAAIGGAVASIAMGILAIFWPETHDRVPPGFESGVATLAAILFGYFAKEKLN